MFENYSNNSSILEKNLAIEEITVGLKQEIQTLYHNQLEGIHTDPPIVEIKETVFGLTITIDLGADTHKQVRGGWIDATGLSTGDLNALRDQARTAGKIDEERKICFLPWKDTLMTDEYIIEMIQTTRNKLSSYDLTDKYPQGYEIEVVGSTKGSWSEEELSPPEDLGKDSEGYTYYNGIYDSQEFSTTRVNLLGDKMGGTFSGGEITVTRGEKETGDHKTNSITISILPKPEDLYTVNADRIIQEQGDIGSLFPPSIPEDATELLSALKLPDFSFSPLEPGLFNAKST